MKRFAVIWLSACSSLFAQGTLSLEQIGADPGLWPAQVMVVVDHKLPVVNEGKTTGTLKVGPGQMYRVKSIDAKGVTLHGLGSTLTFKADDTDVVARAEQLKIQREAPPVAAPETAPAPSSTPAAQLYKGALPFSMKVPPGFEGPMFSKSGSGKTGIEKSFTYWKLNNPQSVSAVIDVSITRLNPEDQALPMEVLVEKMFKKWADVGKHDLQPGSPKPGTLGKTATLEIPFKGKPREAGPIGEYAGVIHVFRNGENFYDVSASAEAGKADQALPELLEALQTVDFEPKPAAPRPGTGSDNVMAFLLANQLVTNNNGKLEPYDAAHLATKRYVLVYYSASWCPPCREFTPRLIQWYNEMKRTTDDFELVFVSRDKSEDEMHSYMTGDRMPWPAVAYSKKESSALSRYFQRGVPTTVLLDDKGSVLSHSIVNGQYVGAHKPLDILQNLVNDPSSPRGSLAEKFFSAQ